MPRTSVTATTYGSDRRKRQAMSRASARAAVIARSRGTASYSRRGELKTVDTNYGQITLNATNASVTTLNGVALGNYFYQRIGNKVTPVSIDSDIIVVNNSTTATSWQAVRVALIWDKQPTGAEPAYADIFKDVNSAGTANSNGFSGRNLYTSDRFLTIAHTDLIVPPLNAANGSGNVKRIKLFKKLAGFQQQFKEILQLLHLSRLEHSIWYSLQVVMLLILWMSGPIIVSVIMISKPCGAARRNLLNTTKQTNHCQSPGRIPSLHRHYSK